MYHWPLSSPKCFLQTKYWQVGRAGRFGTKGLAITFVSSASDSDVLNDVCTILFITIIYIAVYPVGEFNCYFLQRQVQERFEVDIKELPEQIDTATYSMFFSPLFFCVIVCCIHLVNWFNKWDSGDFWYLFIYCFLLFAKRKSKGMSTHGNIDSIYCYLHWFWTFAPRVTVWLFRFCSMLVLNGIISFTNLKFLLNLFLFLYPFYLAKCLLIFGLISQLRLKCFVSSKQPFNGIHVNGFMFITASSTVFKTSLLLQ